MTLLHSLPPQIFNEKEFSLWVDHSSHKTTMRMVINGPKVCTSSYPFTRKFLEKNLPSIFNCKCFNGGNLSFKKEVEDTELAHLFEHILLEFLCKFKLASGSKDACFRGETSWNWKQDDRGTFHIWIDAGVLDTFAFNHACYKSIALFKTLLTTANYNTILE